MSSKPLLLALLTACAASHRESPPPKAAPPPTTGAPPVAAGDDYARGCKSLLRDRACPELQGLRLSPDMTEADCVAAIHQIVGELPTASDFPRCLAASDGCPATAECFGRLRDALASASYRACGDAGMAPVRLTAEEAAHRRGLATKRFSETPTSREQPAEVCGLEAQLDWLLRVRCDDGSNPFPSREAAHAARTGNVGRGGRCGGTIDRYLVACPEKTYDVYLDFYECGPGESF